MTIWTLHWGFRGLPLVLQNLRTGTWAAWCPAWCRWWATRTVGASTAFRAWCRRSGWWRDTASTVASTTTGTTTRRRWGAHPPTGPDSITPNLDKGLGVTRKGFPPDPNQISISYLFNMESDFNLEKIKQTQSVLEKDVFPARQHLRQKKLFKGSDFPLSHCSHLCEKFNS